MTDVLVQHDRIDTDRVHALAGLLDRADIPGRGDALPPMWHLIYFLPRPTQSEIGPDGHPLAGFPSPPKPGMRRMFAGGRVTFAGRIEVGDDAVATTSVVSSVEKHGRSGPLHFVTTRMEITVGDRLAIVDERDIVYREPAGEQRSGTIRNDPSGGLDALLAGSRAHRRINVDPTLLFRFSALTYNAHRIHYDLDYARQVEGHAGLVVHGPLQALVMAETAAALQPLDGGTLEYRLRSPLYLGQGMMVVARDDRDVMVVDDTGRTTATATVR